MELACVLYGKDDLRVEEVPKVQPPLPGELLVRVKYVGVCGTDVHYWKRGYKALPEYPVTSPFVLGHETSGYVAGLGEGVNGFKLGDRVAIHPMLHCGRCEACLSGKHHICYAKDLVNVGNKGRKGGGHLRGHITHSAEFCFKLDARVGLEEAALLEPFVVGVYACERAEVRPGSTLLICGAGAIGMLTLVAAKAAGASVICVTDLSPAKLKLAKRHGATHTLRVQTRDPREVARLVVGETGQHVDSAIDCSGTGPGIYTAVMATKPGGIAAFAGLAPPECSLPLCHAAIYEINIRPVMRYGKCFPKALRMMTTGQVDLRPLATHVLPLEKVQEAFDMTLDSEGGAVKILIDCSDERQT